MEFVKKMQEKKMKNADLTKKPECVKKITIENAGFNLE